MTLDSQCYIRQHGIPLAVYADKHTTYRSPAEPTIEEQLAGAAPQSQFGRALVELGVELIAAHSPQAKGRVERLFKTFQDRVIKELRLAEISTLDAANAFLKSYLPIYNRRFAVPPAQAADLHRPRPTRGELDRILCIKTKRVLRRDWTVAHNGYLYQVQTNVRATQVLIEERVDGTLRITHQGHVLAYARIAARPGRPAGPQTKFRRHRGRSHRRGLIHGANGRCLHENSWRRDPSPKTGHFYFGRKRTFLNWIDKHTIGA